MSKRVDLHAILRDNCLDDALRLLSPHMKSFSLSRHQCAILWYYNNEKWIKELVKSERQSIIEKVRCVKDA